MPQFKQMSWQEDIMFLGCLYVSAIIMNAVFQESLNFFKFCTAIYLGLRMN